MAKILRTWTFWIRIEHRQEAQEYLEAGRLEEMRAAPGNRRATALFRERQDGTTVMIVMSIWDSMKSIRAFVGRDHDRPKISSAELARVFDSDNKVAHYPLSDASVRDLLPLSDAARWNEARATTRRIPARKRPQQRVPRLAA